MAVREGWLFAVRGALRGSESGFCLLARNWWWKRLRGKELEVLETFDDLSAGRIAALRRAFSPRSDW
jgi:hypothetical protein